MAAHNYPEPAIHLTDDPTVVRLFIETYAFPLPTVDLAVGDCHESYYNFYHSIRRNPHEQRHKIPLHMCSNWEGQFDDLKQLEEREARLAYEALRILSLGPVVRVIRVLARDHRREYAYRRWVAPAAQQEDLGNRREAIEYLQRNGERRKELLQLIALREEELKKGARGPDPLLLKYYWALCYLRLAVFPPGTTEHSIVERELEVIESTCRTHGLGVEDLSERTVEQQIARCKELLGQDVEWIAEYPTLQKLPVFVLGKSQGAMLRPLAALSRMPLR